MCVCVCVCVCVYIYIYIEREREGLSGGSVVNNLPANAGDQGSIPELERFPGEGKCNPL